MSAKEKERRKVSRKSPSQAPLPPDKRKYESDTIEIGKKIKELEAKHKALVWRSDGELKNEIAKLSGELTALETERSGTTVEVKSLEGKIAKFGPDIVQKKDDANKLLASLRHKTEERIDEAIRKLEQQLSTKQFSANEERRLQSQIHLLQSSKENLKQYLSAKAEIEQMRNEQDQLRKNRDSLYHVGRELRDKIGTVKDKMEAIRKQRDEGRERQKEIQGQRDVLSEDIQSLYKARQQLSHDFRRQQAAFLEASSRNKEEETEERERESQRRERERRARRRRQEMELEMQRETQYDEEKWMCRGLIAHLQKLQLGTSGASTEVIPSSSSSSSTSSSSTASVLLGRAESGSSGNRVRESRVVPPGMQPGEFLPRRKDEVLVPATHSTLGRKKSKRDKRRNTLSGRAPRLLQYDPMMLSNFSSLQIPHPTTHLDIPHALQQLQEKLLSYERKASAGSEAGDSGVGSTMLEEISEGEVNSQDDVTSDPSGLSPKRNSIESGSFDAHLTSNGVSASSVPLVKSLLDPKALHHSISTSTSDSTSSTTLTTTSTSNDE